MMRYITIKNSLLVAVAVLFAACSDDFFKDINGSGELNGISLGISVVEQADLIYEYGQTRGGTAAMDSDFVRANALTVYPLEGGESENLYVHRMPLPFVGIHPRTAHGSNDTKAATRAPISEIAGNGIAFHDSLTIWGYTSGRTGGDVTLFDQILVQKINGFRTACEWPYATAGTMKFYAIAPAIESIEENINITNKTGEGKIDYIHAPQFTYTVPDAPEAQRDLVYGTSWENSSVEIPISRSEMNKNHIGEDNRTIGMKFEHILTAIRFAQGKMPTDVTIKQLKLSGIKNKGSYNGTAWSSLDGNQEYAIDTQYKTLDYDPDAPTPSENVYIDNNQVLFLMPQTLAAGATLTVVLRKDGEASDRTLTCDISISDNVWQPGYTVTYKITIGELKSDYYLVIQSGDTGSEVYSVPQHNTTGTDTEYSQASGSAEYGNSAVGSPSSFTVHSFRNYLDYSSGSTPTNIWHNVGWKVAGYSATKGGEYTDYNSGTAPSNYISALTIGGNSIRDGGTTYTTGGSQTVTYTMANQAPVYTINHQTILTANNNVTAGFNLSTTLPNGSGTDGDKMSGYSGAFRSSDIYNSANSYIVNAQGTYKFPLVYGNSYQAGSPIDLTGNTIFVDHNGKPIKHANILNQLNNVDNYPATTVWDNDLTSSETSTYTDATKKKIVTTTSYGVRSSEDITLGLIWQDVNGLFSSVNFAVSPSAGVIGFANFVVSSTPKPGNCVIALKGKKYTTVTTTYHKSDDTQVGDAVVTNDLGDDEILWTWHIWVTDEVYPNAGTVDANYPQYNSSTSSKIVTLYNSDGSTSANKILPVNLGWVPDDMTWNKYEPREVWVKLVQTGSSEVAYIKLCKEAKQDLITGTSTVYQWGRPTALPMVNYVDESNRYIYPSWTTEETVDAEFRCVQITAPHQFLQNPTKILRGNTSNTRWWETDAATTYWASTKTLYDPCPPGFQLTSGSIFKFMSMKESGANIEAADGALLNIWDDASGHENQGGWFYTKVHVTSISNADRYGTICYMPSSGLYSGTDVSKVMRAGAASDLYGEKSQGYTWTYEIESGSHAFSVRYNPRKKTGTGYFYSDNTENPCYALPIRPQKTP